MFAAPLSNTSNQGLTNEYSPPSSQPKKTKGKAPATDTASPEYEARSLKHTAKASYL